jgi:ribosomal protein L32
MSARKHHAQQFELAGTSDAFNLAIETTQDGAAIAARIDQARADRAAQHARQIDLAGIIARCPKCGEQWQAGHVCEYDEEQAIADWQRDQEIIEDNNAETRHHNATRNQFKLL